MTDRDETEQLALAYVYGELDGDEAKAFEARLDGDAELRAEVSGLVATREMLDEDAAWGAAAGHDDPPPHLVDAILRAEALARPREIREAQAAAEKGDKPWVQRLSLWILGGGAALTAAATLLLFVGQEKMMADEAAPTSAALEPAAEKAAEVAAAPEGAADKAADGDFGDDLDAPALAEAEHKPAEPERPQELRSEDKEAAATRELSQPMGDRKDRDAPAKAKPSPKPQARSRASATGGDSFGVEMDESEPLAEPTVGGLADGRAGAGSAGPADDAAPEEARTATPPAAPAPPKVSGALRGVLDKKGAKKAKRRAPRSTKERKKSELKAQSGKLERQEQLTMEVATGQRELSRNRPQNAIAPFRRAQQLDPSGTIIGASAIVGLMQAHHMLKQHAQVLDLVPQLMRFGLKADGVGEALLLAADSAERLGKTSRAEQLYADAAKVKRTRARALRAMKRMKRSYDFEAEDSAAAAEPPAAADER